jgi:hypothetical protein
MSSTTSATSLAIAALAASIAGCSVSPQQAQRQSQPISKARSTATTAVPIIFSVKDRQGFEYITRVQVEAWRATDDSGRPAEAKTLINAVPYVGISFRDKRLPLRIARLSNVQGATWEGRGDQSANAIILAGQTLPNVDRVSVMACPDGIADPKQSDCLQVERGQFEFQFPNGFVRTAPLKEAAPRWTFWDNTTWCLMNSSMADVYGRVPTLECPQGRSTHTISATEPAVLQATFDSRGQKRAQAAQEEERLRKLELERKQAEAKQKLRAVIERSAKGTNMFCESSSLLSAGNPITSLSYRCDLTGRDANLRLRELLDLGWDVVSESRVPDRNIIGEIAYSISLRMRKI